MRLTAISSLLALTTTTLAGCECGYSTNPTHDLFTRILETDFLHTKTLPLDGDWLPQTYNVTPAGSHGPYGKIAQPGNINPNPISSPYDWGASNDPGLELYVRSTLIPMENGGQGVGMSEIVTSRNDILYGTFRIGMKTTPINGTCGAFFFYFNDTEEIDLEFLSSQPQAVNLVIQSTNTSALGYVPAGSQDFINQNLGFVAGEGYHEYRFDWLPDRVDFYVDGVLVRTITENVPSVAGRLHVVHWSNGNEGWSGGPPGEDARLVVSYVKGYFKSSSTEEEGGCGEGGEVCVIPDQKTPPEPGGMDGNVTGKTFFLGMENTTDLGDDGGSGPGNGSSPTKGAAMRLEGSGMMAMACTVLGLVAAMMMLGA